MRLPRWVLLHWSVISLLIERCGSVQSASLEPAGLRQLVGGIRKIEEAMGDGEKRIIEAEIPIARKLREHLDLDSNH